MPSPTSEHLLKDRTLRFATYNIHGGKVPGKATPEQQDRAWHLLATHNVDVAVLQEVEWKRIPTWARERWDIVSGADVPDLWGTAAWGSAVAARPEFTLQIDTECHRTNRFLGWLSDYVLGASITIAGLEYAVVSVHAPAKMLGEHFKTMGIEPPEPAVLEGLAPEGEEPWPLDVAFRGVADFVKGRRFLIGGDWNNARLFDFHRSYRKKGKAPLGTLFFTRAMDEGWHDCHGNKNEQRTFFRDGSLPLQLDHIFCDAKTARSLSDCYVVTDLYLPEISDHAPVLAEFGLGDS